jgi:hypothetical protein
MYASFGLQWVTFLYHLFLILANPLFLHVTMKPGTNVAPEQDAYVHVGRASVVVGEFYYHSFRSPYSC